MWPNERVIELVREEFLPVRVHVKDQADEFQRLGETYGAQWTPTILTLDPSGQERHRMEGFLPAEEFVPHLKFGLGRIDFARGEFESAERRLRSVVDEFRDAEIAPMALYWAGVAKHKASGDAADLEETAAALEEKYPGTPAAKKASVWRSE